MSSSGPNSPSSTSDRAASPAIAWTNPNNIQASDDSYATRVNVATSNESTDWIDATTFGFAIPAGSVVDGILVELERKCSANGASYTQDLHVQLLKAGSAVGTDKADTVTKWPTTDAYVSYGGAADLWGTTWTDSEINAAGFGVCVAAKIHNGS